MAEFYYNSTSGAVEEGKVSPATERVGPFATAEEAARAPEVIEQRRAAWAEEEAEND
ncbi:SPOR domain-containing protein [Humidisolicoccus flavus]|uniref:SPOR domain-containing protein n=1 Tax=Humidisolicoccus flavus TaxID=3111414 RepID=UPI00324EED6A